MLKKRIFTTLAAIILAATMSQNIAARWDGGGDKDALSKDEIADIEFIREEEKLARDSYLLLGNKWGLTIFDNISESEQRHMDAMEKLIDKYGLIDPVGNEETIGGFVDPFLIELFKILMLWGFESELDALYVGGAIEETDILDIEHAILRATHDDIIETYKSLVCGSRNHLRSFVRKIEAEGESYEPFILTDEQLEAILIESMEQDCGVTDRNRGKH